MSSGVDPVFEKNFKIKICFSEIALSTVYIKNLMIKFKKTRTQELKQESSSLESNKTIQFKTKNQTRIKKMFLKMLVKSVLLEGQIAY